MALQNPAGTVSSVRNEDVRVAQAFNSAARAMVAMPDTDGELAWVEARLAQLIAAAPATHPVTGAYLVAEAELIEVLGAGADTVTIAGVDVALEVADAGRFADAGAFAAGTYELTVETGDIAVDLMVAPALGFAYAEPVDADEVETRWTLQTTDRLDANTAATISSLL